MDNLEPDWDEAENEDSDDSEESDQILKPASLPGTRVFQYGLLPPTPETKTFADNMMFQSRRFYNNCIKLHRTRKEAVWALYPEEVRNLYDQISALRTEKAPFVDLIQDLRGNKPATNKKEHQAKIKEAQETCKVLTTQIKTFSEKNKELRAALWLDPAFKAKADLIEITFSEQLKLAMGSCGIGYGTYNAIAASAGKAAQIKGTPKFSRYTGEGTLTVQLQGNLSQEGIFVKDSSVKGANLSFQINPVDPRAWDKSVPKSERKKLQRTRCRFRVGTQKDQSLGFIEFPMVMHRPLPEGVSVAGASVTRRKQANREVWTLQITVKVPTVPHIPADQVKTAVAIDPGWRSIEGGLRVGYWVDNQGNHGEFMLPASIRERFAKASAIKSLRDQLRDAMKTHLLEDLKNRELLDPELRQEVLALHMWKSQKRFVQLYLKYKDKLSPHLSRGDNILTWTRKFKGETENRECSKEYENYLEAWRHRDRHLWQYETGLRQGAIRHRNSIQSNWAADFITRFDMIILEDLKLKNLSKKAIPENKADISDDLAAMNNASRKQRVEAAPARFKSALINAAGREGRLIVAVDAKNTSRICSKCGYKNKLGPALIHVCKGCGVTYDRDRNAGHNILARGISLLNKPEALELANQVKKPKPPRFAKKHLKAKETLEVAA